MASFTFFSGDFLSFFSWGVFALLFAPPQFKFQTFLRFSFPNISRNPVMREAHYSDLIEAPAGICLLLLSHKL